MCALFKNWAVAVFAGLAFGTICADTQPEDPLEPILGAKAPDPAAVRQAIETRKKATREYLDERISSAIAAIEERSRPSSKRRIPPQVWRAAKGVYIFDQWQAGHLITTEVCVGLGAARTGNAWGDCVFYRAFDLGRGLTPGTRQARRIYLFVMSERARSWMDLSRWDIVQAKKEGAKILSGPLGDTLADGFDLSAADVWVYDDSGDHLKTGESYPGMGTILDNPWASQSLYELEQLPSTRELLQSNRADTLPLPHKLRQRLEQAAR